MVKIGYIYKLAIKDGSIEDCYVGSTSSIKARKYAHKNACNNDNNKSYNYPPYKFIRDNGGFDNWNMYPLEKVTFEDKIELVKKEREWIEKLKPSLNTRCAHRTNDELKIYNRKKAKESAENNVDRYIQYQKKYRENNRERKQMTDKIYRENNKEAIKLKMREKYMNKQSVICEQCKKQLRPTSINYHSKICIKE